MDHYRSVVITGGQGMLARALAHALLARATPFHAVDILDCDITQPDQVERLFRQRKPTLLLNCAAHTKVDLCENQQDLANAVNGYAVGTLARCSRECGAYLVHISTDAVFDGQSRRPYRPEDPVGPLSAYARSKLLGEQQLLQSPPTNWLLLRTAWLFGEYGLCFPRTIIERVRAGLPLRVVNDQVGAPTYAPDLADAILQLVDRSCHGIWHVTNSGSATWYDLAAATIEETRLHADLAPISTADWLAIRPKQARRAAYSVLDIQPFIQTVDYSPRHWRQALIAYGRAVQANAAW